MLRYEKLIESLSDLALEITSGCNLQCSHCYSNSSPFVKDPNIVNWEKVIHDASLLGCKRIQFIGGEPACHPNLLSFISTAKQNKFSNIEVYTNLTLLNKNFIRNFKQNNVSVATSFYHYDEKIHDQITNSKGSFRKTVEGIKQIIQNNIPLRIGIISFNLTDSELNRTKKFLYDLGVNHKKIRVDKIRPVGRGEEITTYENMEKTLCGACWKGKLTVSSDGTVYPCIFARNTNLGNVNEQTLYDIMHSKKIRLFRETVHDFWKKKRDNYSSILKKSSSITNDDSGPDEPGCDPDRPCDPNLCSPDEPCDPDDECSPPSACSPEGGCPPDNCAPDESSSDNTRKKLVTIWISTIIAVIVIFLFIPIIEVWSVYDPDNPLCWVDGCGGPLPPTDSTIRISLAQYLSTDWASINQGLHSQLTKNMLP